jgi:hypothetical protein
MVFAAFAGGKKSERPAGEPAALGMGVMEVQKLEVALATWR